MDIISGRKPAKMPPKSYPRCSLEGYRIAQKKLKRTIRRRRSNAAVPPPAGPRGSAAEGHEAGLRQGLALDQDLALQLNAFAEAECWRTFTGRSHGSPCAEVLGFARSGDIVVPIARRRNFLFQKERHYISENQTSCYPL
jgi:hypothetical protein